jgi:hypothetical protein
MSKTTDSVDELVRQSNGLVCEWFGTATELLKESGMAYTTSGVFALVAIMRKEHYTASRVAARLWLRRDLTLGELIPDNIKRAWVSFSGGNKTRGKV